VTEGGGDAAGVFHQIPRIDSRLAEIFAREVLSFLVGRELPAGLTLDLPDNRFW
jgi:hypothetical protein